MIKEKALTEYTEFKEHMISKSKEEIFSEAYQIYVKDEIFFFIQNELEMLDEREQAALEKHNDMLSLLYDYFLHHEYANVGTVEDTANLIRNFLQNEVEK